MKLTALFIASSLTLAAATPIFAADAALTALFNKQCASCHGKDGKGQTTMGKKIGVKDFTDPKVIAEIKDDEALKNLKEGITDKNGKQIKKPFTGKISEDEMKKLIEFCKKEFKK